jgi:mannosyltransferase
MSPAWAGGRGTTRAAGSAPRQPDAAGAAATAAGGHPAGARDTGTTPAQGRGTGRARAAAWGVPAAAAAVVIALALWDLGRHGAMGNDEVVTRYAATLSLSQLFHLLSHVDVVHGAYYLVMHAWVALGSTPTVLRIPSVIAMAATAALIAIIGRRLTGSGWAGLFAGLIAALTPSMSFYAQTARSYTMVQAGVVASTLALVYALDAEAAGRAGRCLTRRWILYGVLVVISSYLNELALLALAAHAVTVLLARYGRRVVEHFAVTAIVSGVIVAPIVLLSFGQRDSADWITRPDLRQVGILWHDYFGGTNLAAGIVFAFALVALLPPRGWRWRRAGRLADGHGPAALAWWDRPGLSLPSVALPLVTLPGGLLMLESVVAHPLYVDRYVLYGEAGGALLAGAGCYRAGLWLRRVTGHWLKQQTSVPRLAALAVVPGVVACLCALLLNLGPQQRARTPQSRLFDFGSSSFYVGAHARPGDGILFFNSFFRKARYGYPADFRDVADFAMAVSPQRAGTFNGVDKPFAAVRPVMLGYQRIWVFGRVPSAGVADPDIRAEGELLLSRYRLATERHYKNITVTLWVRS